MPPFDCSFKDIFIADDDAEDRELFEDAAHEICNNLRITAAVNGQQLMTILEEKAGALPDVIFLDLNMPVKNGFDCLKEIKSSFKFNKVPVVILSTNGEKESIKKAYDMGADYYLCKPNSFSVFKDSLIKILNSDNKIISFNRP